MRIRIERIRGQSDRFGWMLSTITTAGQDQCNGIPRFVSSAIDINGTESKDTTHHRFYGYKLTNGSTSFSRSPNCSKAKGNNY